MWNMPLKNSVFITHPSNIYNAFFILAWQFDKSALCEQAGAGMVT